MRLINTIEVNPYDFALQEYEYPTSGGKASDEERDQFWTKCISDKNLGRLKAIRPGSYLVDISTINNAELEEILRNELEDVDLWDFDQQVGSMIGGIVLEERDVLYIEPSCCGNISNILEWADIPEKQSTEWNQLWIGHPWIYYRNNNGIIEFSDYTESNPEDLKDIKVQIGVSQPDLQKELDKVRLQQDEFTHRIKKVLDKMGIEHAQAISKLMTGNA
jgi:hypothetical protein